MPLLYLLAFYSVSLTPSHMMWMATSVREGCSKMLSKDISMTSVLGLDWIGEVVITINKSFASTFFNSYIWELLV